MRSLDFSTCNPIVLEDVEQIIKMAPVDWEIFSERRVLITGASGFLAAYLIETLLHLNCTRNLGIHVTALVRNYTHFVQRFKPYLGQSDLTVIVQDVSKPINLTIPHHFIIHAASQASPKYYGVDPVGTLSANVLGTMQLLELARNHPVISFMYFSSGEVYGETQVIPTKESDYGYVNPISVRSCYAESKRMAENMCVSWHAQYQVPAKIVRPFHTYGPGVRLDDGRVYSDFIQDILNNRPIKITSKGDALRAFCYLSDATAGFFTVLLKGESGVPYNVGNSDAEISVIDLANLLVNLYPGSQIQLIKESRQFKANDYLQSPILRNCPDIERIKALGWNPQTTLADGFKRTIESYLI